MTAPNRIARAVADTCRDTLHACRDLYIVMVPAVIAVKVLQELDLIRYLAMPLEPLMRLVGLPAEMGLAWAATLINGIYSGILIFLQLAQAEPGSLTVAQVTTLGTMMLIAHAIPVECGIAHKCGARFLTQAALRIATAIVFGIVYRELTDATGTLQGPAAIPLPFESGDADPGWAIWALGEAGKLLSIGGVIFVLLLAMKLLRHFGALQAVSRGLEPMMRLIGVGAKASTITMIGLTLGMSYGSGIIIRDSQTGELAPDEVFCALSFMGICHSLIEDTLLMLLIGSDLSGILWLRMALCMAIVAVLVRLVRRLPQRWQTRFLWVARPATA